MTHDTTFRPRFCTLPAWLLSLGVVLLTCASVAEAQQVRFSADDAGDSADRFGASVALSGDGQRAIVSAVGDDIDGVANQGSVYFFTRNASDTFEQEAKLTVDDGQESDSLGIGRPGVAINADGTVAIAGAPFDNVEGRFNQGTAYIFTRDASGTWSRQTQLIVDGGAQDDRFGSAVAINDSGDRVLVGAELDDGTDGTIDQGAAYVFVSDGSGSWTQEARLESSSTSGKAFPNAGDAVALSGDGNRALVGAWLDDLAAGTDSNEGSATVFTRDDTGGWTEEATLRSTDIQGSDLFGRAVSLNNDGTRALVGAPLEDGSQGTNDQGAAYVFERATGGAWTQTTKLDTDAVVGDGNPNFGETVALSGNGQRALIGAFLSDPNDVDDAGSAFVFGRSSTGMWTEEATILADSPAQFDNFGNAVAISDDGQQALVGIWLDEVGGTGNDQGAVFALGPASLPVELASFTAQRDGRAAQLVWRTFTETNNDGFEIQRRSGEAIEWQTVDFVESQAASGTSSEALRYRYRTEDLAYGRHTFRLVQKDLDGTPTSLDTFTPTVEVQLSERFTISSVYPNPLRGAGGTVDVTVRETQNVTVALYDALGRQVRVLHDGVLQGSATERVTLASDALASGMYMLRVQGDDFTESRKVVVVR